MRIVGGRLLSTGGLKNGRAPLVEEAALVAGVRPEGPSLAEKKNREAQVLRGL